LAGSLTFLYQRLGQPDVFFSLLAQGSLGQLTDLTENRAEKPEPAQAGLIEEL
jgi:hypothetical protein